MSFPVASQERFIFVNLEEQVRHLLEQEMVQYSLEVEFGIAELVRNAMRQLAQIQATSERVILERSLETTERKLNQWVAQVGLAYDFTPYFLAIRKGLRLVAREISELSQHLEVSRRSHRVTNRESIVGQTTIPLEMVQVGLPNATELLLVIPLAEEFELDLEGLRQTYSLQGQWFPYQLTIRSLTVLLDDDGTLLISTMNLSDGHMQRVKEVLLRLAKRLYHASS